MPRIWEGGDGGVGGGGTESEKIGAGAIVYTLNGSQFDSGPGIVTRK